MRALAGQGTWNLDELVMQELCLNDERLRPYPGFKGLPCAAGHAATGPAQRAHPGSREFSRKDRYPAPLINAHSNSHHANPHSAWRYARRYIGQPFQHTLDH